MSSDDALPYDFFSEKKKFFKNYGMGVAIFFFLTLSSGLALLFFGASIGIAYHNIDLAYNMCVISNDLKAMGCQNVGNLDYRDWKDQQTSSEVKHYYQGYLDSSDIIIRNSFLLCLTGIVFGVSACCLYFTSFNLLEKYKEKEMGKWTG